MYTLYDFLYQVKAAAASASARARDLGLLHLCFERELFPIVDSNDDEGVAAGYFEANIL
jgi:hypothetical protein